MVKTTLIVEEFEDPLPKFKTHAKLKYRKTKRFRVLRKKHKAIFLLGVWSTLLGSNAYGYMNSYSLSDSTVHKPDDTVDGYIGGMFNGLPGDVARVPGNKYNFDFVTYARTR